MQTKKLTLAAGLAAAIMIPSTAQAAYTGQVQGDTLKLTGDATGERLRLEPDGPGTLVVDVGADGTADFSFDKATFTAVEVAAGGGDDEVSLAAAAANDKTVSIDGGAGDDTLLGGAGTETLLGGGGNDTVDGNQGADVALLGGGNDHFNWDPGDGSDIVEGQTGTDALNFNGANIGELFDVSANGNRVRFTRNIASITMDLDDVEALNLRALGGADIATVNDLSGTDLATANVDLAGFDGNGDAQADAVIANGTAGADQIAADASGIVTGPGGAQVRVSGAEADRDALRVDGLGDSDTVSFAGTPGADRFDFVANGTFARLGIVETSAVESVVAAGLGGDDTFSAVGNLAPLTQLTFDGGSGNDAITGSNGADTLLGGTGNDTVDGNQGNDEALLGSGNDHFNWDPGDGSDTVEGQTGTDTLDFNGSNIGELFDVSANGSRVRFTRNIANITMDLDDVEALHVRALGGTDTATVNDMTGTDLESATFEDAESVIAKGTTGDDQFGLAPDGTVSGLGFPLHATAIDGGDGADTTTLRGTSAADVIDVVANGTAAHVAGVDNTVENVVLNGLGGDDTIRATGNLLPIAKLTFDGGSGNDAITGSNGADTLLGGTGNDTVDGNQGNDEALLGSGNDHFNWDPGDGSDTVEGQTGTDTLDFNGSNIGELFDVSANGSRVRFTRNIANITMDLDDVEALGVRALSGTDTATVGDLTGTDLKTAGIDLGADGQPDTVVLNGTNARDVVKVSSSGSAVLAKGLKPQLTITGSELFDTLRIQTLAGDDSVTLAPGVDTLISPVIDLGADG